jgi:signal peptidase I
MCEANVAALLSHWRERTRPVIFVRQDRSEPGSPLAAGTPGNAFKDVISGEPDLVAGSGCGSDVEMVQSECVITDSELLARRLRSLLEVVVTVAVAIGLALLIQAFVVKPYKIPSGSMLPTLGLRQRILVYRMDTHPGIGDVVVFHPPHGAHLESGQCADAEQGFGADGAALAQPCDRPLASESRQTFVKRVVGLPGDVLRVVDGHVIRNGEREPDGYIAACDGAAECTFSRSIRVPAGDYYMMGDNRGDSDDSRFWGPVPQRSIIGVAFFTYWPLNRIGVL